MNSAEEKIAPQTNTQNTPLATMGQNGPFPKSLGYRFPAEWEPHRATWLSWIHKEASWPGKLHSAYPPYVEFIQHLSQVGRVCINVNDEAMKQQAIQMLQANGKVKLDQVDFYIHPTNDAWCRDHGPSFLINENGPGPRKIILDWGYNAWGGKYPPFDEDDQIPTRIGLSLNIPVMYPGIVMEGGSVEFNGAGTLLTTKACLLNPNRNPHLDQAQIERLLTNYYAVDQILWLDDGIEGDDTDGHIDDLTRFVNEDTVLTVVETDRQSANYPILEKNLQDLKKMRLLSGKSLNVIELPMPAPVIHEDQPLPASYANFYITNNLVVVPIFGDKNDDRALQIIQSCFPSHRVEGIYSRDLIWGLGAFHCLSQQEPL